MKLYSENKDYKLYQGSMLDMLEVIKSNSIDSVITDPPYELNFMGKGWDNSGIAFQKETWEKCYEVLKPGGYLLAFGGSRTFHRIACAIEDAGFEIRDTIMWLYGSGFPKSMSLGKVIEGKQVLGSANVRDIKKLDGKKEIVGGGWNSNEVEQGKRKIEYEQVKTEVEYTTELGKQWQGWGTCLKPSFEPIIVARKPFKGSLVDNVIENGVGGINIDECRVAFNGDKWKNQKSGISSRAYQSEETTTAGGMCEANELGRFPSNTIIDEEVALSMPMGSQTGKRSQKSINNCIESRKQKKGNSQCDIGGNIDHITEYNDSGSVSRYFYCAKASKKDRDEGLGEKFEKKQNIFMATCNGTGGIQKGMERFATQPKANFHPTVKPTELMQYLVRLVSPDGATILDPFNGSGSTGKAVMYENKERNKNYKYIGIELTEEYLPIAKARIEYAMNGNVIKETTQEQNNNAIIGQTNIFDFIEE